MEKEDWNDPHKPDVKPQTIDRMHQNVKIALEVLGKNPSHQGTKFTKFQREHKGQYVSSLICLH